MEREADQESDVEDLVDVCFEIDCLHQVDLWAAAAKREPGCIQRRQQTAISNRLRISQAAVAAGETNQPHV